MRALRSIGTALMLFCCAFRAFGDSEVLWWMVDSSATVRDGATTSSIQDFFTSYGSVGGETSYYAARVKVQGGNITEDVFLDLYYYDDETGSYSTYDGVYGVPFSDAGGYWGAGVPEPGTTADFGEYSGTEPEYSFLIEIGNVVDDEWTTIASSDATKYSDLAGHISSGVIDVTGISAWKPVTYATPTPVPEPSSGLLLLIGSALLALRRRPRWGKRRLAASDVSSWGKRRLAASDEK